MDIGLEAPVVYLKAIDPSTLGRDSFINSRARDWGYMALLTITETRLREDRKTMPPFICRCKIVQNKLIFCTLHKEAETLLAVCDYLHKFIRDVSWVRSKTKSSSGNRVALFKQRH